MRVKVVLALVMLGLLLIPLAGCNSSSDPPAPAGQAFTVGGTVTDLAGTAATSGTVTLQSNGVTTGNTATINGTGGFTLNNVAPGTYTLLVTTPNSVATVVGPVTVSNANVTNIAAVAPMASEITGVTTPTNTTATLVVYGLNSTGTTIPNTVGLNGGAPTAASNPVILTGLSAGPHAVTVTDPATNATVTFPGTALTINAINVMRVTP